VHVDSDDANGRELRCLAVKRDGRVVGDAEFALAQTRCDVGVRLGIDVGVHAQGDRGKLACARGERSKPLQLRLGFDVEAQDAGLERGPQLRFALADARENGLGGAAARGEHSREFSARDDVEAGAESRKEIQYREVGIRLDRIADEDVAPGAGVAEFTVTELNRRPRVDVGGRAEPLRYLDERHVLRAQRAIVVRKKIHWRGAGLLSCLGFSSGPGR
jgi:hypothetical protein